MKKILIFLILLNISVFSAVNVEKNKIIPTKYKPTSITDDKDGNIYASSSFVGAIIKYNNNEAATITKDSAWPLVIHSPYTYPIWKSGSR